MGIGNLSLMGSGQMYRADEVAGLIGLKGSRTRQLLRQLVDQKEINVTAGTKNRRYFKAE